MVLVLGGRDCRYDAVVGSLDWDVEAGARPMTMVTAVNALPGSRVGLFESTTQSGWYIPSKAEYDYETDSEQVPRGKVEKNSEERVKKDVKPFKRKLTELSLSGGGQSIAFSVTDSPGVQLHCRSVISGNSSSSSSSTAGWLVG